MTVGRQLARWWSAPASPRAAYAVAAGIGLAVIVLMCGPGYVLGTSHYWDMPEIDHRSYVMGYRYFLHEPWHWPLLEVRTLNVPYSQSIAFNDSLPLWALLHKAVATVIPPWRGYSARAFLGLWYGLTAALQTGFGVANLRALGHRSWGATIVTSVFFIAIPAWLFRFYHASLFANFLLLSALYLYLITPAGAPAPRRVRVAQLVQLGAVALLNPYHTVMSLAVFGASLVRARAWRAAVGWLVAGCAVVTAALALAGFFAPQAATALWGFRAASTNLLAPFVPRRSGWFGDAGAAVVDGTRQQYEGMCYLGLGVLALLAALAARPRDALSAVRRHAGLAVAAAGIAVIALSNDVYLGTHRVLAYPVPHFLHWIPDQFRAPGRLSWLPMYVVVIFALSRGFERFAAGWKRLVLPVLAVVQLVDAMPYLRDWRSARDPAALPLDLAAWRTVLQASDQVTMFPSHACNGDVHGELAIGIQYLASQDALPINGVHSARTLRDCVADTASALDFQPRPRTLYVFVAPMTALARRLAATGMSCAEFAFGEACALDRGVIEPLHAGTTPPPALLAYGDRIDIADPAAVYLELGWSSIDVDSRWIIGPAARLVLRPTGAPPADPVLRVEAFAVLCGGIAAQDVDVSVGGAPVGTLHFDAGAGAATPARMLPIPPAVLFSAPFVEIELRLRDAGAPHPHACHGDHHLFGVHVRRVSIEPASGPSPVAR